MGGLNSYPMIDTGNPFTVIDTYNAAQYNNGARCPLGTTVTIPLPQAALASAAGRGAYLTCKYVRYNSTANPTAVTGPAPVFFTDETLTTVTGVSTEALASNALNFCAGWLLPSTSATYSLGTAFTAAALNGNYVWIGLRGFIPAAISATSVGAGDLIIPATGNFTVARGQAGTTANNSINPLAIALTGISSLLSDIYAILPW